MKAALQAKLLHVLQDAEFTKLGSNKRVSVDVRVIAATNRDLEEMLRKGEFREDLYYRLKVIDLLVPALRERRDEIAHLTDFFLARYARKYNRPLNPLSAELRELFMTYEWPGNIRELENMIKRIVILQDEHLVISEIQRHVQRAPAMAGAGVGFGPIHRAIEGTIYPSPPPEPEPAESDDAPEPVEADTGGSLSAVAKAAALKAERSAIQQTLRQVHWNRRKAAQMLGVSYKTLLNKIKECGITRV
jgi:DNA-binding NtrC family response regulator